MQEISVQCVEMSYLKFQTCYHYLVLFRLIMPITIECQFMDIYIFNSICMDRIKRSNLPLFHREDSLLEQIIRTTVLFNSEEYTYSIRYYFECAIMSLDREQL